MDPCATSHSNSARGTAPRVLCSASRSMRSFAATGVHLLSDAKPLPNNVPEKIAVVFRVRLVLSQEILRSDWRESTVKNDQGCISTSGTLCHSTLHGIDRLPPPRSLACWSCP